VTIRIVDLPAGVFPRHARFWLRATTAGPRGLDGRATIVSTENRYWEGEVTLPPLELRRAMAMQAAVDELRGRATILRVPLPARGALAVTPDPYPQHYSDGATFSDGARFAGERAQNPTVAESAAAGAQVIRLAGFAARNLSIGAQVTINGFLYRVASNDEGLCRINPPLREALATDDRVRVFDAAVLVRLAEDDAARLAVSHDLYSEEVTFMVDEAFER
jgi:hypothetical protein